MTDGPRIILQAERFRIVELDNGNKLVEKNDGCDALGVERWRELKFGEAESTARMLRDWIFEHVRVCPQEQSK